MTEGKKQYTISYLAKTESDKETVLKSLNHVGAQNIIEGRLTELKLAYPIKKQTSALFGSTIFEGAPEMIIKIDEQLKFAEGILRFLIVTASVRKTNPRFIKSQKDKEDINNINAINSINNTISEDLSIATEAIEQNTLLQTDKLPLIKELADDSLPTENHVLANDDIDEAAFDEKLKELLTNS